MAPRPRNPGSKDLPPNLYRKTDSRNGITYYTYRDPVTGRMFGLGKDKDSAIREAVAANCAEVLKPALTVRLAAPVVEKGKTFSEWLVDYKVEYAEKELSLHTTRNFSSRSKRLEAHFGDMPMRDIKTMDIASYLTGLAKEGKANMSKAMRSILRDIFAEGIAAGVCDVNPVDATKAARAKVTRERLSLELWKAIYETTNRSWLKRAMELALLTGQRRDDIRSMLFKHDQDGFLHIVQSKTGARLRISTAIRLEVIGLDLAAVIKRCRDHALSQHLVHYSKPNAQVKAGYPVTLEVLTRQFAKERDKAAAAYGITLSDHPPSFHEMRSLSARLHAAEGRDPQKLLGHKTAAMTDLYRDSRGTEWIDVA
jgi:integrase